MLRLIENVDALHTCDDAGGIIRRGWIVVEDGQIASFGGDTPPDGDFAERIDLAGSIAMPGLVNTHHHFFQTLTRALPRAQKGPLLDWLEVLYPVWALMTPDELAAAAAATAAELLLTGATTSVDHFYLVPNADPAFPDATAHACRSLGLRLHLVRGSMTTMEADLEARLSRTLGPRAGGVVDDPATVLSSMRDTVDRHHRPGFGSMSTVALGPTTPTYRDPAFMREVAVLARDLAVGVHMHVHPQPQERELCRDLHGKTPLELLDDVGLIGPRTWLAHATRIDAHDIALLARRGAGVAHCPRMILRLGARIPPVHAMRAAGVPVAVGVDGGASNDSGSMLGEMRLALLLHRLTGGGGEVPAEDWMTPQDVLTMATRTAAHIIGRDDIGVIAPSKCADITAFDMRGVGYAGARSDLLSGLLLAGDDTGASFVMVAGETRVRHGKLVGRDEEALRRAADEATASVLARAAARTGIDYLAFPA